MTKKEIYLETFKTMENSREYVLSGDKAKIEELFLATAEKLTENGVENAHHTMCGIAVHIIGTEIIFGKAMSLKQMEELLTMWEPQWN